MDRTKKVLISLLVLGALAAVGTGTYATFNAQVQNSGNSFATGTIFLSQTLNTASACLSYGTSGAGFTNGNANSTTCGTLFNVSGATPGTIGSAGLIFQNTGSINSSHFYMALSADCNQFHGGSNYGNGNLCTGANGNSLNTDLLVTAVQEEGAGPNLTGTLSTTSTTSSLTLPTGGISQNLPDGALLLLVNSAGTKTQVIETNGAYTSGSTTLNLVPFTANNAYTTADSVFVPLSSGTSCWVGNTIGGSSSSPCSFNPSAVVLSSGTNSLHGIYAANANLGVDLQGTNGLQGSTATPTPSPKRYFALATGIPNTTATQNGLQGLCLATGATPAACGSVQINFTIQ